MYEKNVMHVNGIFPKLQWNFMMYIVAQTGGARRMIQPLTDFTMMRAQTPLKH